LTNGSHIRIEDLELLALGALPQDEAAAVLAHVSGCDECARALAEARGRVALLAFSVEQEAPPAGAKQRLMARIAADRGDQRSSAREAGRADVRAPWWNWVLVPASLALAAVCLLLSWQNRKLGAELDKARTAATGWRQDADRSAEMLRTLTSPDTISVKLGVTGDTKQGRAVVKYNQRTGTILYTAEDLPPLPAGKVYQMWLVPTTGTPIDAGVFDPTLSGRVWAAQVPANTAPKAFAVTIEPTGGLPKPSGPQALIGAS
jgi:anti-sigma-K factor RskA